MSLFKLKLILKKTGRKFRLYFSIFKTPIIISSKNTTSTSLSYFSYHENVATFDRFLGEYVVTGEVIQTEEENVS